MGKSRSDRPCRLSYPRLAGSCLQACRRQRTPARSQNRVVLLGVAVPPVMRSWPGACVTAPASAELGGSATVLLVLCLTQRHAEDRSNARAHLPARFGRSARGATVSRRAWFTHPRPWPATWRRDARNAACADGRADRGSYDR